MNFWAIFLTGLTTGGLSCVAMQGGLLASIIANQKEEELEDVSHIKEQKRSKYLRTLQRNTLPASFDTLDWLPVTLFLVSKLIAHIFLGFFLGWLGSKVQLSLTVRLLFQGLAAFFMLATAGNLLDLHPLFRYVVFQPPKFIQRWVRNSTKSKAFFTPAVLGLMTIFIPCGVTQAMEVLAVTSGSPLAGALIMFFFVLGTSPVFAVVGVATAKLSEVFQKQFMRVAAVLLIFLALSSLNGILVVLNSPLTFSTLTRPITYFFSEERFANDVNSKPQNDTVPVVGGVQQAVIRVTGRGYTPGTFRVKAGMPVNLTVQTKDTYSCASSFLMKAFNISMQLGPTDSRSVTFTPTQPGRYPFSCSMGMYRGVMEVI